MGFKKWISKWWGGEKEAQIADAARGTSTGDTYSPSGNNMSADGTVYEDLAQSLTLDTDLMLRYVDYEQMDDYPETSCLAGESLVFTLEKGWVRIEELAAWGEPFHVISYDRELKSLIPVKADGARMTGSLGHEKPMVRVLLDSGHSVRCTSDHLFMTKEGKWIEADNLNAGTCLMTGVMRMCSLNSAASYDLLSDGGNHRVMAVEPIEDRCEVYDISVPGYYNFVCNGVVVHNSALDIYADDATIPDSIHGKSIWAGSQDKVVRDIIDDCLHRRINIEEDVWIAVRTLVKYGNLFGEVVTTEIGVVGINWLPTPTVRRIVNEKGVLIGFVQDLSGQFNYTFKDAIAALDAGKLPEVDDDKGLIFFLPWEVVHWRLRSKMIRAQYGYCLVGDSQVWTPKGMKRLDDVRAGDVVYTRHAGMLRSTRVLNSVCSGKKDVFKLKTTHREVRLTDEHPVLVRRGENSEWLSVKDLSLDDSIMAVSSPLENLSEGKFVFEKVESIESDGNELVYDIAVDNEEHNFIANGLVVHNSILDAARWVYKRLQMMEDTALVQKLCLRGDSQVWTADGRRAIKDLEEGDEVLSYTPEEKLVKTRVVYKKCNGKDVLYHIKSSHRELYANATHPILIETIVKNGSGVPRGKIVDYVEVQNLEPGKHRLITPTKEDNVCEYAGLAFPEVGQKARLNKRALEDGVRINIGIKSMKEKCGVQCNHAREFFAGEREIVAHTAEKMFYENGTSLDYLDYRDDWGGVKALNLPENATEDFARWFGFMIGDGFASERPFKKGDRTYLVREVGFAAGDKDGVNQEYRRLMEGFFGNMSLCRDKRSGHKCVGKYSIASKSLYEFMILNGFVPGAHNKRIPGWVFASPVSVRQAFLDGLADADGHRVGMCVSDKNNRVRHERVVLELCNEGLVQDVRELCMQTGYVVGTVRERLRKGGRKIKGNDHVLSDRISYTVEFSHDRQPLSERLVSVEKVEVDDIWDIGVEAEEHNFVANGIVVHNTRAPGRFTFYVDTGDLPPKEAMALVRQVKRGFKKKKLIDPATGKLDYRYNSLSPHEDIWIPTRGGKESTRVEVLAGPDVQMMEDVEYFRSKMIAAMKVPKAYLGLGEGEETRATLSQTDVRFARACMRVQREFIVGMRKVVRVHLAALNVDPDSVEWRLKMTIPSAIFEMQQIEVMNAQAELAGALGDFMPKPWVLKHILHFTDEDAATMTAEKNAEMDDAMKREAATQSDVIRMYPEAAGMEADAGEAAESIGTKDVKKQLIEMRREIQESNESSRLMLKKITRIKPHVMRSKKAWEK